MKVQMIKVLLVVVAVGGVANVARASLQSRVNAILAQPAQKAVRFSVHIVKADSGKTVYSHNADVPMMPASNMKLIVTAAALKFLGPDFKYNTRVGLCGSTLVVIGSGDPLLGDQRTDAKYGRKSGWIFDDITQKLKDAQVTSIQNIIIDTTVFDDERVHPNWPKSQLNRWYACEVSGLNYNDNCIDMTAKKVGQNVAISIVPDTSYVEIVNNVVPTQGGKDAVGAYRNEQENKLIVKGKCSREVGPFFVAIERPGAFFGFILAEHLAKAGIATNGQLIETAAPQCARFRAVAGYSTSISDCLARANKKSLGLAAEALMKTIAANADPDGKNGSWQGARARISRFLTDIGIDEQHFDIDDGSGLSRKNRLAASTLTKVLVHMYRGANWSMFKDSLAVGGGDGTIRTRFREAKYKGKIRGKTGYIRGVKAFSGVCSTDRGEYMFAILANSPEDRPGAAISRTAINAIAKAIIDGD